MSEFSLINKYCLGLGASRSDTFLSVGDDAALLDLGGEQQLAVSVDTMVEGVHFREGLAPELLAYKLLAVNLSDMAAMGAEPRWATLALTLPEHDESWISAFSASLDETAKHYGVELVGGDTTAGPLCASLQIMGVVQHGQALLRGGAQVGDSVYVSGCLGDAALALHLWQQNETDVSPALQQALDHPTPQVALGQALRGIATAAIDVSDGLMADLGHIAKASNVSLRLEADLVPTSDEFQKTNTDLSLALQGGDDYELAFTAPKSAAKRVEQIAVELDLPLTQIGEVVEQGVQALSIYDVAGNSVSLLKQGFDHFG